MKKTHGILTLTYIIIINNNNNDLSYKTTFAGNCIKFKGRYPVRNEKTNGNFAQEGILTFKAGKPGAIKVTFSDTGKDPADNAHRRYLTVNGERTIYWTSRPLSNDADYESRLYVTTGWIPVDQGDVTIEGDAEGDLNSGIRVMKIEYHAYNVGEGLVDDLFTQRIITNKNGISSSTWIYGGYSGGTHGLVGGLDDNGIIYISNNKIIDKDADNGNGNIKFSLDNGGHFYTHFLSSHNGSTIYIPVPKGSSGKISMIGTQTDNSRCFKINETEALTLSDGVSSFEFNSSHIVNNVPEAPEPENTYLKLQDNGSEMKVLSFTVTLAQGFKYDLPEAEVEGEHGMGKGHKHAIFNFTEGDLVANVDKNDKNKTKGTLTLENGSRLIGEKQPMPEAPSTLASTSDDDKVTAPIWSFRGGDLVKYKKQYYGALQLLSNTDYTLEAPKGYHITSSIRFHGQNNKDKGSSEPNTIVSDLNGGSFKDTEFDWRRDDESARTTTLDMEVTASKTHKLNFSGYQFLGVIDAVLVPDNQIPTVENQVFYTDPSTEETKQIIDGMPLFTGGKITYNGEKDLWWYFEGSDDNYGQRGCITSVKDPEDDGAKDQITTKTFSVKNFRFTNQTGTFTTLQANDLTNYYPGTSQSSNNVVRRVEGEGDETTSNKVTLNVNKPGTFYFYIKDPETNFNSVLVTSTFNNQVSGVEDVVISDEIVMEEDENAPIYNVYGQRVDSNYHGIVIKNGHKYYQR